MLPKLKPNDYIVLGDLMKQYPREFYTDVTNFYISQMYEYIDTGRIFRSGVMGPTREGKSEIVSSLCFLYVKRFNENIEKGTYLKNAQIKTIFDNEGIKLKKLKFTVDYVYSSTLAYAEKQRERAKDNNMIFGQCHQIDEDRKTGGGLGSMTAQIENQNINNISAKFMQTEFYITPDHMITKNAPYGLRVYKKDLVNRINYSLLYKIEMNNRGGADFKFMGWVGIPLHPHKGFRVKYNELKDSWILTEIKGGIDERAKTRYSIAEELSKSKMFLMNEKGRFDFSRPERLAYFEQQIIKGVYPNFNEVEKIRIVEHATLLKKQEMVEGE